MWVVRLVVVSRVLGFSGRLLLAGLDLTPEGIKRTDDLDEPQQQQSRQQNHGPPRGIAR